MYNKPYPASQALKSSGRRRAIIHEETSIHTSSQSSLHNRDSRSKSKSPERTPGSRTFSSGDKRITSPDLRLQQKPRQSVMPEEGSQSLKSLLGEGLTSAEVSTTREVSKTKRGSFAMNLESVPEEDRVLDMSNPIANEVIHGEGSKSKSSRGSGSKPRASHSKADSFIRKPVKRDEKVSFRGLARKRTMEIKQHQNSVNSLVGNLITKGMQFIKFMKELSIDHKTLPKDIAQILFKKVDEIERITKDSVLSRSLRDLKVNMNRTAVESTHSSYLKTTREIDQQRVQDAVSGVRHKKFMSGIKDQKKVEEGRKVQFRLVQNTGKFFYEVDMELNKAK